MMPHESRAACASPDTSPGGMLDSFRAEKEKEVSSLISLERKGKFPVPLTGTRPSFRAALAAPRGRHPADHRGIQAGFPLPGRYQARSFPGRCGRTLCRGRSGLSFRTDGTLPFQGRNRLSCRMAPAGLPLLRKDFILHPLQVRLTAATPASALLLIVRLTPDVRRLRGLRELTESFGMEAVVEIFSAEELALARESGARVIQVNARDLDTLRVDRTACLNMGAARRDGEIWIAASGMSEPDHLAARRAEAGFDAALWSVPGSWPQPIPARLWPG